MYKRILCPVDGSPSSNRGMFEAIHLAKDQNAKLRFLHVVDTFYPMMDVTAGLNVIEIADALSENGKKILKKAVEAAQKEGLTADSAMKEAIGDAVAQFIVSEAKKWPADLIVMSTHGLRGIERLVMGSDAETVVRTSHVPVLLIRSPAKS
ncbi:MAG: universal stress protein [Methylotenera sp.]|jgi:nucleotide-binding universal stress UspA family protein|nr:universal stress protein [Methylotenera sp.]